MKETIKAGIGGYAFTFDVDAYQALNAYLENLKVYFQNKNDGQEILEDIEGRMSELLQLQAKKTGNIITLSDAQHIMEIMGNPVDFADGEETDPDSNSTTNKKKDIPRFEKKLYRDTDHSVLGGVCSGLGQYFRVDPVIIRIIYVLSVILSHNVSHRLSGIIFISYFVLWIVMPKAKTIAQKIAMSGQNPSIEAIESGNLKYQEMRGGGLSRTLGKIIKIFAGIILYLIGISIILSAFFALFFPSIIDFPSIKDFLEANALYSNDILVAGSVIWLIPAFMVIYLAIKLMTKFTARDLIVIGLAFIVWLGACSYIGVLGVKFSKDYKNEASYNEKFISAISSDTVRIRLGDVYKFAESTFDSNELYMLDGSPKSWFLIPRVEIIKDSTYKNIEVEVKKKAFARSYQMAEEKAKGANLEIKEQNTDLIINPHIYNKNNLWDREVFRITIYCPDNKTIIVEEPLQRKTYRNTPSKKRKSEAKRNNKNYEETDTITVNVNNI